MKLPPLLKRRFIQLGTWAAAVSAAAFAGGWYLGPWAVAAFVLVRW
jgi:hypothetical protein